jgi:hypothetical protein
VEISLQASSAPSFPRIRALVGRSRPRLGIPQRARHRRRPPARRFRPDEFAQARNPGAQLGEPRRPGTRVRAPDERYCETAAQSRDGAACFVRRLPASARNRDRAQPGDSREQRRGGRFLHHRRGGGHVRDFQAAQDIVPELEVIARSEHKKPGRRNRPGWKTKARPPARRGLRCGSPRCSWRRPPRREPRRAWDARGSSDGHPRSKLRARWRGRIRR